MAHLDAFIASQPDPKPSRPEMIRRLLTERLQTSSSRPRTSAATENDANARSHAASTADAEMSGMDATAEQKTSRRKALTDEPAAVTRAKAKRPTRG